MAEQGETTEDWLRFSVDSHLVGELGLRLVAKNYVALAELIKNSYDADATHVTVHFENTDLGASLGRIEITDDGHGMTFTDVKNFWMRVATPNKAQEPQTPLFGRQKAGNKGIGRFACQRLAHELELVAIGRRDDRQLERTTLKIRWADFTPGSDLTEIPCEAHHEIVQNVETGLTLRLEGLRDAWGEGEFRVLRRQLVTLTIARGERRPGFEGDPGFSITLDAPEFESDPRPISDQVMDAGWGRLKVDVGADGAASFFLDALGLNTLRYVPSRPEPLLKGLHADLAIIPRGKSHYRLPQIMSVGVADDILDNFAGIRVYMDGFRVYPYGEPRDDWLSLDKEAAGKLTGVAEHLRGVADRLTGVNPLRARLYRPRNGQLYGGVDLGHSRGTEFVIKSNREGFVESASVAALRELLRDALDWTALYYQLYVYRQKQHELVDLSKELAEEVGEEAGRGDPVEAAFRVVGLSIRQLDHEPAAEAVDQARKRLQKGVRALQTYFDQTRDEVGTLRVTASTGVLMLAFSHDIRSVLATLASISSELDNLSDSASIGRRKELKELASRVGDTRARLENQLSFWGLLTRLAGKKSRERVPVAESLNSIKKGFGDLFVKHPVKIDLSSIPLELQTPPMIEGEFYAIALNLLSNSLKAVWASESGSQIKVRAKSQDDLFTLEVLDDGVSIPHAYFTNPPEVYVPDPERTIYPVLRRKFGDSELASVGTGTGLGLSIVQSIVEAYGGKFQFVPVSRPWTKIARVTIPG